MLLFFFFFFFQAEEGIRVCLLSRGLGDVYKSHSFCRSRRLDTWFLLSSRTLGLVCEASILFARQVDAAACASVADVAAALFEQCCGAVVCEGVVDTYPVPAEPGEVTLRPDRVRALCGAPIETSFMAQRLRRLGCEVEEGADDHAAMRVVVPTSRPDLTREIDLVEEVLRLWGVGDVTPTLPAARNHAGGLTLPLIHN